MTGPTDAEERCFRCRKALSAGDARSLSDRRFEFVRLFIELHGQPLDPYCARCATSLDRGLLLLAMVMGFGAAITLFLVVSGLIDKLF